MERLLWRRGERLTAHGAVRALVRRSRNSGQASPLSPPPQLAFTMRSEEAGSGDAARARLGGGSTMHTSSSSSLEDAIVRAGVCADCAGFLLVFYWAMLDAIQRWQWHF